MDITNVRALNSAAQVVAQSAKGDYVVELNVNHISMFPPCATLHGGPTLGIAYSMSYDVGTKHYELDRMTYDGVSPLSGGLRFSNHG